MNTETSEIAAGFSAGIWQAEVLGKIYETNLEELSEWINEGALLPEDKVRRGNLRWLEARKVPQLIPFFNAKANGTEPPPVITSIFDAEVLSVPPENIHQIQSFTETPAFENFDLSEDIRPAPEQNFCALHAGAEAAYVCGTCGNAFCKACPNSYGGNVKICPMCGAMCVRIVESKVKKENEFKYHHAVTEGFGFSDFGKALAYPFKFKTSLFFGAAMFMFFTIGQSAAAVGGMFMIAASVFCFMLANMLTFGILANTIDKFTQGKTEANFMPDFDDFSPWDDVVHPFFLSIGAYLSAFGPMILMIVIAAYLVIGAMSPQMNTPPQEIAKQTYPQQYNEEKIVQQSEQVNKILESVKKNNSNSFNPNNPGELSPSVDDTEESVRQADEMIRQMRKDQLESAIGKSPETAQMENAVLLNKFLAMGGLFLFLIFIAFLWGIFYFPAACAVAGYTRSFAATINPAVGLDTIKRLGFDYAKIWLMGLMIVIFSGIAGFVIGFVLSPFDLPRMGNIPAKAIGSFITFYFSVVFSCILGFALYKASDRLKLYKA